jgi:hypothetical protein
MDPHTKKFETKLVGGSLVCWQQVPVHAHSAGTPPSSAPHLCLVTLLPDIITTVITTPTSSTWRTHNHRQHATTLSQHCSIPTALQMGGGVLLLNPKMALKGGAAQQKICSATNRHPWQQISANLHCTSCCRKLSPNMHAHPLSKVATHLSWCQPGDSAESPCGVAPH